MDPDLLESLRAPRHVSHQRRAKGAPDVTRAVQLRSARKAKRKAAKRARY